MKTWLRASILLCISLSGAREGLCRARDPSTMPPPVVYVYGSEATYDFRLNYSVALVNEALRMSEGASPRIEVRSTADDDLLMNRNRSIASLESGHENLHVLASFASRDLDKRLRPIRISIAASLLGERLLLMRADRRPEFEKLTSLESLRPYLFGIAQGWIDGPIMEAAGLRTVSAARYDSLFPMLSAGRFDLMTRGIFEVWDELRVRGFRGLDYESSWSLSYPAPFYLYVNKKEEALAARLEKGLEAMDASGRLNALFVEHFGPSLLRVENPDRRRLILKNPNLPHLPPLHFSSWEEWHKKAELRHRLIYSMAEKRFGKPWRSPYHPELLIDAQLKAVQAASSPRRPPLIMRAADRPNDTHMLAALFGLELALAQSVNASSPYFQNAVKALIDPSLSLQKALEKLNKNEGIDTIATQSSLDLDQNLAATHVDLAQGLLGARVLVLLKKDIDRFKSVRSIEDLQKSRICVGQRWPDRTVLEEARIPTVTRLSLTELYLALKDGACDAVTRGIYEVRDELLARPLDDFAVDPHLLITYPASFEIFFARNQKALARAAEVGLRAMEKSGILQEIIELMYGDAIRDVGIKGRWEIRLKNSTMLRHVNPEMLDAQRSWWAR